MKQIANFGGSTTSTAKETISKVKTTRETVTSSTTLQDDEDFTFSVKANTTYAINGNLFVSGSSACGFKWLFTVPSGANGRINATSNSSNYVSIDTDIATGFSPIDGVGLTTTAANGNYRLLGFITTTTAGTLTFQWAQKQSSATAAYIERGSTMLLTEV
jgi:hypothetical protein